MLTSWTPDSNLQFERNPKYWDAPRPYINKLQIQINLDQETNAALVEQYINQVGANS